MNPALQSALTGEPVMVTLGGEEYPLAYPMQAVIVYKRETAALDRERKRASDRPSLTRDEKHELRERRRKVLAEAEGLRPEKGEAWDDDRLANFMELLAEAMQAKGALDEDAAAGDSLYDKGNWWKISPESDPERLLLALWVGLHKFVEGSAISNQGYGLPPGARRYVAQFSREELGLLIDLRNGEQLTAAISKALRAHMIAPAEEDEEEAIPNGEPAEILPETMTPQK